MFIYYNTTKQHVEILKEDDKSAHKVLKKLLKRLSLYHLYSFDKNVLVYIDEQLECQLTKIKQIFQYIKSNNKNDLEIFLIINNRYEPRNYQKSISFNYAINRTNIPIKNIHILTGSHVIDEYNLGVNLYFFPNDFMNFFKIVNKDLVFDHKEIKKTKLVSSLNRRLNPQRIRQTAYLLNHFTRNEMDVSLGVGNENPNTYLRSALHSVTKTNVELPLMIDIPFLGLNDNDQFKVDIGHEKHCLLSVINETIPTNSIINESNVGHDAVYYSSEKSFRPILNQQIPIFNSAVGYTKWFEKTYKMDLFKDFINYEKWDRVMNIDTRSRIICDELLEFKEKYGDVEKFYQEHKHRFMENLKKLESMKDVDQFIKVQ